MYKSLFTLILTILFVGCANSAAPLEDIQRAKMALLDAQNAKENKIAGDYFKKAQNELSLALEKMKEKSYDEAKFLAQKATADARVAKIKATNFELKKEIDKLDLELKRVKKDFVTIDEAKGE